MCYSPFMSERLDEAVDDHIQDLRNLVLSEAIRQGSITRSISRGEKHPYVELYPYGGKHPFYSLQVNVKKLNENSGEIARLSFGDFETPEAHVILEGDGSVLYEERDIDAQLTHEGTIDQHIAATLLGRLTGIFA
jgi:hypothetical protein